MRYRSSKGQNIVEYSIGIGCVVAAGLLVLGGLGFGVGDVARNVLIQINDPSAQTIDPSIGSFGGIFSNGVAGQNNVPWAPR